MTEERANKIAAQIRCISEGCDSFSEDQETYKKLLLGLPEFQEKKSEWIKCSDKMPEKRCAVYCFREHDVYPCTFDNGSFYIGNDPSSLGGHDATNVTHWMLREVPKPPIEEETELVKELRMRAYYYTGNKFLDLEDTISLVKRHEKR